MKFTFLLALFSYHTQILMEKYLYSKELESIKKSNRFRTRELFDDNLVDLASNPGGIDKMALLPVQNVHFIENRVPDFNAPVPDRYVDGG